jgi:DNA-binding XRE family transcriptional regulator
MSYGYSAKTIQLNKRADSSGLGVALGRAAIKLGISVADVAATLRVSRQTVYNWFVGSYAPKDSITKDVTRLLNSFNKHIKEANLK